MRAGEMAWRVVGLLIPAVLIMVSVALLAAAVGAMMLGAPRATQWSLFAEGVLCWAGGLAWGWLANGRAAS